MHLKLAHDGYILEECNGTAEHILIGTGTELDLCVQAAKQLAAEGKKVRVVSMPCIELFDEQSDAYRERGLCLLPSASASWWRRPGHSAGTASFALIAIGSP